MKRIVIPLVSIIARVLPTRIIKRLYQLGPLSNVIRRFLNRISPVGFTEIVVAAGGNKDMRMELDLQSEKDYWLGTYEVDLQKVVLRLVQRGWGAYDVGANIGYFSLLLSKVVGENGFLYSFEPLPANLERLRKNLYLNDLHNFVNIVPSAVIDETKEVQFLFGPSGAMGKSDGSAGRDIDNALGGSIKVQGISLDDFVYIQENPTPQIIKMDIEGGEVLALRGMTRLLKEARPLLFLELHGDSAAKAAWDLLTVEGYKLRRMADDFSQISSFDKLDWKSYLVALP